MLMHARVNIFACINQQAAIGLVSSSISSNMDQFFKDYRLRCPAAKHRLKAGVSATDEYGGAFAPKPYASRSVTVYAPHQLLRRASSIDNSDVRRHFTYTGSLYTLVLLLGQPAAAQPRILPSGVSGCTPDVSGRVWAYLDLCKPCGPVRCYFAQAKESAIRTRRGWC